MENEHEFLAALDDECRKKDWGRETSQFNKFHPAWAGFVEDVNEAALRYFGKDQAGKSNDEKRETRT